MATSDRRITIISPWAPGTQAWNTVNATDLDSVKSAGWRRLAIGDSDRPRPRASRRDNIVMTVLSGWLLAGLTLDAWAHSNLSDLETFFTPWHGVFYSGFTATGAWVLVLIVRHARQGRSGVGVIPVGYGWTVAAALYIAVACIAAGRTPTIIEMWTGAPILAGLAGWLLAVLMLPCAQPATAACCGGWSGPPAAQTEPCTDCRAG
jgi:hypothetical protein